MKKKLLHKWKKKSADREPYVCIMMIIFNDIKYHQNVYTWLAINICLVSRGKRAETVVWRAINSWHNIVNIMHMFALNFKFCIIHFLHTNVSCLFRLSCVFQKPKTRSKRFFPPKIVQTSVAYFAYYLFTKP